MSIILLLSVLPLPLFDLGKAASDPGYMIPPP